MLCRMLGFNVGVALTSMESTWATAAPFPTGGTAPGFWLDNVFCNGTELDVGQ